MAGADAGRSSRVQDWCLARPTGAQPSAGVGRRTTRIPLPHSEPTIPRGCADPEPRWWQTGTPRRRLVAADSPMNNSWWRHWVTKSDDSTIIRRRPCRSQGGLMKNRRGLGSDRSTKKRLDAPSHAPSRCLGGHANVTPRAIIFSDVPPRSVPLICRLGRKPDPRWSKRPSTALSR